LKKNGAKFPLTMMRSVLGSATVPVAAAGVPPGAFGEEGFRPEAENGGRDARAPRITASLRLGLWLEYII
jgi:hypothetical protein